MHASVRKPVRKQVHARSRRRRNQNSKKSRRPHLREIAHSQRSAQFRPKHQPSRSSHSIVRDGETQPQEHYPHHRKHGCAQCSYTESCTLRTQWEQWSWRNCVPQTRHCPGCERRWSTRIAPAIHHVIWRSKGGKNDPANGQLVCTICHQFFHSLEGENGQRIDDYILGLSPARLLENCYRFVRLAVRSSKMTRRRMKAWIRWMLSNRLGMTDREARIFIAQVDGKTPATLADLLLAYEPFLSCPTEALSSVIVAFVQIT